MLKLRFRKTSKTAQYLICLLLVGLVSTFSYGISSFVDYHVVALLFLVTVSVTAMLFDIVPVFLTALMSALIWDFFFIPPKFNFSIGNTGDTLMLLMYFIIAMVNASLTFKIRQIENVTQKKEVKEGTIKLYNTLLNSLSHELRTPIATIIGATDNLQSNKLTDNNKKELLQEIHKASFRLNDQVENLLNMSRIDTGHIQPKKDWCDIAELIYSVVNHFEDLLSDHPLKVELEENLPLFKLDFGLMEQVLKNIISNAAMYTPKGTPIIIKSRCKHEIEFKSDFDKVIDDFVIIIEDKGPGFPEDEISKVFDKFYRLKNTKTGGNGLGLSIAKGFVEAHGGYIILENQTGGGASFTITIPTESSYLSNLKNE